ncbi:MAG: hypothetical protein JW787_11670 [Sedimentisphaerales bacterium]|nr:hypothetical protein [Sedimentisphaerales bacterium]
MTGKEFINSLANGKTDIIQVLLDILSETDSPYCLIGGLAVNAYTEPVVSLDLDIVAASDNIEGIRKAAIKNNLKVEEFEHSVNLNSDDSDLRIQLQTDSRYQKFLPAAQDKEVLGYRMMVARIEDVLQGKVWAYMDKERRKSKRQKDLADIFRIIEKFPYLKSSLPQDIQEKLDV